MAGKTAEGGTAKGAKNAMKGEGAEGAKELGEDGVLLAGVGFSGKDKTSTRKNVAERANLERFLQEMGPEQAEAATFEAPEAKEETGPDKKETKEKAEKKTEKPETKERGEREVRREEAKEEARVQGQMEAKEQEQTKESRESADAEGRREKSQDEQKDDEEKPGAGWLAEELQEEETKGRRSFKLADPLSDKRRCQGTLEDGSRCLRRAEEGVSYCREHGVGASVHVRGPQD